MLVAMEAGAEDLADEGEHVAGHQRARACSTAVRAALEAAGIEVDLGRADHGAVDRRCPSPPPRTPRRCCG